MRRKIIVWESGNVINIIKTYLRYLRRSSIKECFCHCIYIFPVKKSENEPEMQQGQ